MDTFSTWDNCFAYVFQTFKKGEKIQNTQAIQWFQIWTRAYKNNRMKNPEYVKKWEVLLAIQNFNRNYNAYESFLKAGAKPSESSLDKKERLLAAWYEEQMQPDRCIDPIRMDVLKTTYPSLLS
jgi:hypothetical protein